MTTTISKVSANGSSLDVKWSDGEKSSFNFLWLRDNCPSEIHKDVRERTFNILNISEKIAPESFKISEDGKLEVKWNEDKHISYYEPSWLRKNCYTIKRKKTYVSPYILWDKTLNAQMSKIQINYDVVMKNDEGLIKWLELLHYYGIAIIKNAPIEKKSAIKILNKISHTRQTFFDTPFEVINIPRPNNSAYTADSLRNHMDLPYFETPPGYQFLHCLVNNAEGGNSSAADGFKIAEYLKNNDKDTFNILKKCKKDKSNLIFLSSSRVYSIRKLRELKKNKSLINEKFVLHLLQLQFAYQHANIPFLLFFLIMYQLRIYLY